MTDLKYCMSCRQMRRADGFKQMNRYRNSCSVCAQRGMPVSTTHKKTAAHTARHIEKLRDLGKID